MTQNYSPVALYSLDGTFVAYAIMGLHKLHSTNIWGAGDETTFNDRLKMLNEQSALNRHWPHPQDPEVQALLNDENFMPPKLKTVEVVDEENSTYVYKKLAGQWTGHPEEPIWLDSDEVDEEASTIVYKTAQVPEKPTDVIKRIKTACEQVAKQRASLV